MREIFRSQVTSSLGVLNSVLIAATFHGPAAESTNRFLPSLRLSRRPVTVLQTRVRPFRACNGSHRPTLMWEGLRHTYGYGKWKDSSEPIRKSTRTVGDVGGVPERFPPGIGPKPDLAEEVEDSRNLNAHRVVDFSGVFRAAPAVRPRFPIAVIVVFSLLVRKWLSTRYSYVGS